jgi:O-antigen ligase
VSLRIIFCLLFVLGFSIYAWRNWFVSLCATVCMMAVLQHPDMPKSIGGIQGLNPWNFLMANVLLAWWRARRWQGLSWDLPGYISAFGVGYLLVIIWGFVRLLSDFQSLKHDDFEDYGVAYATSEYFINCVKWVLPGLLLFDGVRSRSRVIAALACILFVYFFLSLQVIKHMPLSSAMASGADLSRRANKVLAKSVGYHRVNLSMMFSGASWAMLTTLTLVRTRRSQLLIIAAAATIALGQALTGGRAGYVTWGLLGLMICLLRWRKFLPVIPLTVLAVMIFLPAVRERMLQGFGQGQGPIQTQTDAYEVTSGRTIAWSYVIPKIYASPLVGYGRQAMIRVGLYQKIMDDYDGGETFPHPHNAYLELLLDNGLIGFVIIIPIYVIFFLLSYRVLRDRTDPICAAVGGVCFSLVSALLIAAMGSQSFYPREGSVGMWCAIGLMLRVHVERKRSLLTGAPLFEENSEEEDSAEDLEPASHPYSA